MYISKDFDSTILLLLLNYCQDVSKVYFMCISKHYNTINVYIFGLSKVYSFLKTFTPKLMYTSKDIYSSLSLPLSLSLSVYIYIYIYVCVCVCVQAECDTKLVLSGL